MKGAEKLWICGFFGEGKSAFCPLRKTNSKEMPHLYLLLPALPPLIIYARLCWLFFVRTRSLCLHKLCVISERERGIRLRILMRKGASRACVCVRKKEGIFMTFSNSFLHQMEMDKNIQTGQRQKASTTTHQPTDRPHPCHVASVALVVSTVQSVCTYRRFASRFHSKGERRRRRASFS